MSEGESGLTPKTRLGKRQHYEPPQQSSGSLFIPAAETTLQTKRSPEAIPQPTEGVQQSYNLFGAKKPEHPSHDLLTIGDMAWQTKLKAELGEVVARAGFKVIEVTIHEYPAITESEGYTMVITVGESAITLHTWPEKKNRTVQVDISVCSGSKNYLGVIQDNSKKTPGLVRLLCAYFEATRVIRTKKQRLSLDSTRGAIPIEKLTDD